MSTAHSENMDIIWLVSGETKFICGFKEFNLCWFFFTFCATVFIKATRSRNDISDKFARDKSTRDIPNILPCLMKSRYICTSLEGNTSTCPFSTAGGKPQVPLCALFQARTGTWVEPLTFRNLPGQLPHVQDSLAGFVPTALKKRCFEFNGSN